MNKYFKQAALVLSTVFSLNSVTVHAETSSDNLFRIVPSVNNPGNTQSVTFQVLPDKSVMFYSCVQNRCAAINSSPIPAAKFQEILKQMSEAAPKSSAPVKNTTVKDFLLACGVTHLGATLAAGLVVSASTGNPIFAVIGGGLYAVAPIVAPIMGWNGLGAAGVGALSFLGAALPYVATIAAVTAVTVAIVGGVSYVVYKKHQAKKAVAQNDNMMLVNVTQEDLVNLVKTMETNTLLSPMALP